MLALKANQPDVLAEVVECFTLADATAYDGVRHDWHETVNKRHGRVELRHHTVISDPAHLAWRQAEQHWPGLHALGRVQAERRLAVGCAEGEQPVQQTQ